MLEAEKEERQPDHHVDRADEHPAQIGDGPAQDAHLKPGQHGRDRRHVDQRGADGLQHVEGEVDHHAAVTTPKIRTKMIGIRLAKAISPKPSIIGLRPLMAWARPTPSAVTSGTVIVEVVTPPLS